MFDMNSYNNATAAARGDFRNPPAGAYECVIRNVEDKTSKGGNDMLVVEFDIASGEFRDYAADTAERAGFWPLTNWMTYGGSYTTKRGKTVENMKNFKADIEAIETANQGWKFSGVSSLKNRRFYAVLTEEEYEKSNGSIGTQNKVNRILTAAEFESGNYKVPEKKVVNKAEEAPAAPTFTAEPSDTALPWD